VKKLSMSLRDSSRVFMFSPVVYASLCRTDRAEHRTVHAGAE